MYAIDPGFCCLNPDERGAMRGSAIGFGTSLGIGIPYVLWDALWLPGIPDRDRRQEVFINLYALKREEILFGDPAVLTDMITYEDPVFWAAVLVFVLLPVGACLDGCSWCIPYPC